MYRIGNRTGRPNRTVRSIREENRPMRYLIAVLLPWFAFFTMGKVVQGIICLGLQLTLIGWLPAAIWALMAVSGHNADKRVDRLEKVIRETRPVA